MNSDDNYQQLSSIQHFAFCRRQWALIHIEQQWAENLRTVEGELLHEKVHDVFADDKRRGVITVRAMAISSKALRVSGQCDVVEFIPDEDGITLNGHKGKFKVYPVEYKHGEPKEDQVDILQLVAQAICLEEMLCCKIDEGAIFYEKIRRRQRVEITDLLRKQVSDMFAEMNELMNRHYTPRVKPSKCCNACSLKNLCLPKLLRNKSVSAYISQYIADEGG
ncbi:MAG: CRISPR-associated protein Cas4 [Clostridiales bacterium GWF2_38_85]|nr:MAG: CRISPR-associated protein Cas4 [Clostridiales bacterium GWF2_38_85]HBL84980.1 CRISPR-associated protein Cas4 [Clostridiales bacterium]